MENTKTNAVRILLFCLFIGAIVVVMSFIVGSTGTSTKYNDFAQCLTQKKLKFYGAFWCPHCQAQKAAFGGAAEFLPYVECSNTDRSQNDTCTTAHIESYPTREYPTEISYVSETDPVMCDVQPGPSTQNPQCAQDGSHYYKTWLFSGIHIESMTDPIHAGKTWTFPAGARSVGEQDTAEGLQNLANFSGCTLPAADAK